MVSDGAFVVTEGAFMLLRELKWSPRKLFYSLKELLSNKRTFMLLTSLNEFLRSLQKLLHYLEIFNDQQKSFYGHRMSLILLREL